LGCALGFAQGEASRPSSPSGEFSSLAAKANAARDANDLDDAIALYKKGLALRPSWAEGWFSLGTIYYDQNAYRDATRAFRKVVLLDSKHGTALAMLGLSEFEIGEDDLALKHIQSSIKIGMAKDEQLRKVVLYHEGVLFQRKGKFESAQETLQQLCREDVQNDQVANALGMVMLRSRAKVPPPHGSEGAEVANTIGRAECLAAQRKYDEAGAIFAPLLQTHPEYPGIHYAYGMFLQEARKNDVAVKQFEEEIKSNPGDVEARLRIAAAKYKTDSAGGVPFAQQAVKLDPQLPFAHYLLGLLLLDIDKYQEAIPELEIARKAFSADPKVYFALGSAYARAGRKQDAARARATFERLSQQQTPQ
jgi:tetratricopeptide (TPR) repeat protein